MKVLRIEELVTAASMIGEIWFRTRSGDYRLCCSAHHGTSRHLACLILAPAPYSGVNCRSCLPKDCIDPILNVELHLHHFVLASHCGFLSHARWCRESTNAWRYQQGSLNNGGTGPNPEFEGIMALLCIHRGAVERLSAHSLRTPKAHSAQLLDAKPSCSLSRNMQFHSQSRVTSGTLVHAWVKLRQLNIECRKCPAINTTSVASVNVIPWGSPGSRCCFCSAGLLLGAARQY